MMLDIGQIVFDPIYKLLYGLIEEILRESTLSYLEKRKIRRRVENATAEVVEILIPFLLQEKVAQEKIDRLIDTCIIELKPFTENSSDLFTGSLDGQKIYENLYLRKDIPEVIIEDGLKDTYSLLFPRIATLLCKIPAAVKDWENEAWSENFKRLDDVVVQLKSIFARVDDLAIASTKTSDATLTQFKRMLAQKIALQLDITGLGSDQPHAGKFDDFFVLPEISRMPKTGEKLESAPIAEPETSINTFTDPNCFSIIVGAPGAGKSTWSKWLQKQTLNSEWNGIGIRVELSSLNQEDLPSIHHLIRICAGKQMEEDLTNSCIKKWINENQVVFIFDGFDEIKPTNRDQIFNWLNEVNGYTMGCPIVITSRPLTTDHLDRFGDAWIRWNIEPFDTNRIITYIKKWFSYSPLLVESDREINAEILGWRWVNDPTIGPLTGNPLLLSTLLMVHHLDGKLPNGRANLYKRYIDGMLGYWDERQKRSVTDINLDISDRRKTIGGIALHLFLLEQESIDENSLIDWLEKYLPKIGVKCNPVNVLSILRERTGLIAGPGIYNFVHKTIAEFLVAEMVFQGDQQDSDGNTINSFHLFKKRNDDRWNTVIFLWAGIASISDVYSFIQECIKNESWSFGYGLLFDQYNRFNPNTRQELLLMIEHIKNQKIFAPNVYWVADGVVMDDSNRWGISIKMPGLDLRGVTSKYININTLIRNAILDESIEWEAFSNLHGNSYRLFWGLFATNPNDPSIWFSILTSKIPTPSKKSDWKKLIAQWVFSYKLSSQSKFFEYIDVYKRAYPDHEGYIAIALMNGVAYLVVTDTVLDQRGINQYFYNAVEAITSISISRILPYIQETINWKIGHANKRFEAEGDLLDYFSKGIESLSSNHIIDIDDVKIDMAINFVTKLRIARDNSSKINRKNDL